eukprot:TRINITY_DN1259_c0_g1_i2.p1 TRINITY_DN1259_c0_g1~~TRINITY_DN1259_c0_g1_i2.p1  ORF type:complete len:138 (-),score=11.71 TRINITY_DN1259_c0_g1_i2:95-508(-)
MAGNAHGNEYMAAAAREENITVTEHLIFSLTEPKEEPKVTATEIDPINKQRLRHFTSFRLEVSRNIHRRCLFAFADKSEAETFICMFRELRPMIVPTSELFKNEVWQAHYRNLKGYFAPKHILNYLISIGKRPRTLR